MASLAQIADSFFKPPVRDLVPYEPGKPVEEVQRELGLDRVVKLASNEGPFGPFPEAIEALQDVIPTTGQEGRSEALEHRLEHIIMRKQEQVDTLIRAQRAD